ncbi:MAG TPA: group 1 truncated hemoglobin [Streptosporangiaceae bacterium]|nr:group 1 truncated hemoglobin [Streptosporangiaceae bacterium]
MTTKASLYDHLSPAAIRSVTENFYQRVLADEMLAPYFRDVDMRRLVAMQAAFLTKAFGGPDVYAGRDLRQAHAGLTGLDDQHFDRVLGHLADSLREAGVGETDIASAAGIAESVRGEVLNR